MRYIQCAESQIVVGCGLQAFALEGRGDLVGRFIMGMIRVTIWVIGVIYLLTYPPSNDDGDDDENDFRVQGFIKAGAATKEEGLS